MGSVPWQRAMTQQMWPAFHNKGRSSIAGRRLLDL